MPFGPGLQPGEPPLLNRPTVAAHRIELRPVVDPATDWMCAGADDGTRTRNLRFTKPLLYQLSYVGATGRAIPQMDPIPAPGNDRAAPHGPVKRARVRGLRASGAGRDGALADGSPGSSASSGAGASVAVGRGRRG